MSNKSNLTNGQIRDFVHPGSYWLQRAEQSDRQGNLLRSALLMRHGLEQEECGPRAELQYAWLLRRLGCIHASLRESMYVLAAHPAQFTAYGLIALNMADLGRKKSAMDAHMIYNQFVEMFPFAAAEWDDEIHDMEEWMYSVPSEEFHFSRSAYRMKAAWKHLDEGCRDEADRELERISKRYHPMEQRVLAACLAGEEEDCRELLRPLQRTALHAEPDLLLRCAEAAGRFSRRYAAFWLTKAACIIKTPAQLGWLCHICSRFGLESIAISASKTALLDCPTRLDALFNLCVFALKAGQYAEAQRLAYRLYLLDPEDPRVEKLRGLCVSEGQQMTAETQEEIRMQPFYTRKDHGLDREIRLWLKNEINNQHAFSTRKGRIRLQHLLGGVLSAGECIGLLRSSLRREPKARAEAMLRGYMLAEPGSYGLRQASRMLLLLAKPPYMACQDDRLRLYFPSAMNQRTVGFYQRRVFQTLCIIKRKLGRDAVPLALTVISRLPAAQRSGFLGQDRFVWVSAFCAEYARFTGRLIRPLDGLVLYSTRRRQWITACRQIRKTLKGIEYPDHGKEFSHDETH